MEEKTVHIPKISCGHCVMTIKRELGEIEGVKLVEADQKTKTATIKWESPASWDKINDTLNEAGYPPD
jgi:copper chaperone